MDSSNGNKFITLKDQINEKRQKSYPSSNVMIKGGRWLHGNFNVFIVIIVKIY